MLLSSLIKGIDYLRVIGDTDIDISSVVFDSRKVENGSLFVALKGSASDGHNYIESAIEAGAMAILCQKREEADTIQTVVTTSNSQSAHNLVQKKKNSTTNNGIATIIVADSHKALGTVAANLFDNPSEKIKLIGITGTNGKTTTVTLLYRLFSKLGYSCGLLSTIENYIGDYKVEATHTTPDPIQINGLLAQMAERGCQYCFMEVSSHSIDQQRISGLHFTGGLFSNITHDHLDYHKTFKEYIGVKKRFFDLLPKGSFALTNTDDTNGSVMVQNTTAKVYTYSCLSPADFNCRIVETGLDGMLLKFGSREVWTSFIGAHNAYNLLAVYATATLLGADQEEVLINISSMTPVAGRLEYIKGGTNITAVVDYAHTPDALKNVLKTLKECSHDTEIITVFGCGGDRDRSKRPEMAAISAKYSDRVVVTSDNPRFEKPDDIIAEVMVGFETGDRAKVISITNRREAIRAAVALAKPGSIILVAGKGHENYQDIEGVKHHFDDKEVITETFREYAV